ncbi:MAG TPA: S53 family peptidase, partial [Kofleriaceae bacterium]|nr:S53 family peptidase [Kofleriaceae bacterium]
FRDGYLGATSTCATLTGAGQTIGIFTINTGFSQSDIQNYITNTGLTGVSTPTITVAGTPDGATPPPLANDDGGGGLEASLDIEMAIAMAPGAQVVVFQGNNVDLILEAMVNQPNIAQLTSSWFMPTSATAPQLHTLMAAQGQAFFEASLDFGSYAIASAPQPMGSSCLATPLGANVTFDMPYITIVGGTELNLSAGTYLSESGWAGSGGGVMPAVSFPSWQANANPANPTLSTTSRNAPDVSMPATNIYIVFSTCDNVGGLPGIGGAVAPALCKGNVQCTVAPDGKGGTLSIYTGCKAGGETKGAVGVIGGTSASTPLWAGFMALANQSNQAKGKIGFPNPTLYSIGRSTSYGTSFNDVNDLSKSSAACDGTQYTAVAGYDQVTGWGSPRCGLISRLSPPVTPPSPPRFSVAGNLTQLASIPLLLCGTGSNFTPGGIVTLTMTNVPGFDGLPRPPVTLGTFTVGTDGKFSYPTSTSSIPSAIGCTDEQRFDDVTVTATNPQQQEIASDTFFASAFCINALTPGSFGGGCP